MVEEFSKFSAKLMKSVEWTEVPLNKILLDDQAQLIVEQANPVSGLRTQTNLSEINPALLNTLLIQSPIICYPFRNKYRLIGGYFTYCKLVTHSHIEPTVPLQVVLINKKPSDNNRRLFFLQDLTRALLTEGFVSESKQIKFYLESWFNKAPGKRSIYQSPEWQSLFPELKTMDSVASWLHISKKMLS